MTHCAITLENGISKFSRKRADFTKALNTDTSLTTNTDLLNFAEQLHTRNQGNDHDEQ